MPRGVYPRGKKLSEPAKKRRKKYRKLGRIVPEPIKSGAKIIRPSSPLILRWREGDQGTVRVWRIDWPGDCFEVFPAHMLEQLKVFCNRFTIPLMEWTEEDDESED